MSFAMEVNIQEAIETEIDILSMESAIIALEEISIETDTRSGFGLEGFTDTLSRIFKAIMSTVRNIWRSLMSFLDRTLGKTAQYQQKIRQLRERANAQIKNVKPLKEKSKDRKDVTVVMGRNWSNLSLVSTNHVSSAINTDMVVKALGTLVDANDVFWNDYSRSVINYGDLLAKAFEQNKDKEVGVEAIAAAIGQTFPKTSGQFYKTIEYSKTDIGEEGSWYGSPRSIAGGRSVFLRNDVGFDKISEMRALDAMDSSNAPAFWEMVQKTHYCLKMYDRNVSVEHEKYSIVIPRAKDLLPVLDTLDKLCTQIIDFNKGNAKTMQGRLDALDKAGTYFIEKRGDGGSNKLYKAALGFVKCYGVWSTKIQSELISQTRNSITATLEFTEKVLNANQ